MKISIFIWSLQIKFNSAAYECMPADVAASWKDRYGRSCAHYKNNGGFHREPNFYMWYMEPGGYHALQCPEAGCINTENGHYRVNPRCYFGWWDSSPNRLECEDYGYFKMCNPDGTIGPGWTKWLSSSKTFEDYANLGYDARNCPECGCGKVFEVTTTTTTTTTSASTTTTTTTTSASTTTTKTTTTTTTKFAEWTPDMMSLAHLQTVALSQVSEWDSFQDFGCVCDRFEAVPGKVRGAPINMLDRTCLHWRTCNRCVTGEFGQKCGGYSIDKDNQCTSVAGSCQRSTCECDMAFIRRAEEIAQLILSKQIPRQQFLEIGGGRPSCKSVQSGLFEGKCCRNNDHFTFYNSLKSDCCLSGEVKAIGAC